MQKVKALTLALLASLTLFSTPLALAQAAGSSIPDATTTCTQWQIDNGYCNSTLRGMALTIVNWFLLFLGLVATGFLIFGGFEYITSAGNDQNTGKAKKVIIYAAIGILVVILAAVLVQGLINIPAASQGGATAQ